MCQVGKPLHVVPMAACVRYPSYRNHPRSFVDQPREILHGTGSISVLHYSHLDAVSLFQPAVDHRRRRISDIVEDDVVTRLKSNEFTTTFSPSEVEYRKPISSDPAPTISANSLRASSVFAPICPTV